MRNTQNRDGVRALGDGEVLSVIMPAFNESLAIGLLLGKICADPALAKAELIVVDDGSTDETAARVSEFERVRLVRHAVNKGYGSALVTGMHQATREYVVWIDSDGQHRVSDLLAVGHCLVRNHGDFCIGIRGVSSHQDPRRQFGKWILGRVVRLAAGRTVADFNSGLRGFRTSVIRRYLHLLPKGFGASTTTTLLMLESSYCGFEVPIVVEPRIGTSSVRQVRDGMRTLTLIMRIFLLFKPLHFFGLFGLTMAATGLAYGLWSAFTYGLGFPVLGALVFLSGLQTLFIGLVMDQISAIRRERFE